MSKNDINNINDVVNRDVWLYILDHVDLSYEEYWYMRGMLDIIIPQYKDLPFVSPLVKFLYDKKIQKKEFNND